MNKQKKHLVTRQLNELIGDTIIMREALVAICRFLPTKQEAGQRADRLIGLAVDIRDELEHICERVDGVCDIRETLHSIDTALAALAENRGLTPIYHDPAPGDYGTDQCPRSQRVEVTLDNGPRPNGDTPNGGPTADVPQEATIPPASDAHRVDPGTREGEAAKPPQNAIREFRVGDRVVVSRDAKTVNGDDVFFGIETTGTITRGPDDDGDLKVEARNINGLLNRQWVAPRWLTPVEESAPDEKTPWPTEPGLYWVSGVTADGHCEGIAQLAGGDQINGAVCRRKLRLIDGSDSIWERFGTDRLTECVPLTAVPTVLLERLYDASPDSYGRANTTIHDIEQWVVDHEEAGR